MTENKQSTNSSNDVIYIGVAIPLVNQVPMLFNETVSKDLKQTALKTSEFLKSGGLDIDGDVKMSVIPIDQNLLDKFNQTMNQN